MISCGSYDKNANTNLLNYINIFSSTGEIGYEIEATPQKPSDTIVATRSGIKPLDSQPLTSGSSRKKKKKNKVASPVTPGKK